MFICCECCVLSGRGLCDGLITRPEESYRLWLSKKERRHVKTSICYVEGNSGHRKLNSLATVT